MQAICRFGWIRMVGSIVVTLFALTSRTAQSQAPMRHVLTRTAGLTTAGRTTETPRFADLPWGASAAQVTAVLVAKGYRADTEAPVAAPGIEHARFFKTAALGEPTELAAYFTPSDHLVKIAIELLTPDAECLSTYRAMRRQLVAKYGPPTITIEHYDPPFEPGDGYELTAIQSHKATIGALWTDGHTATHDPYGLSIDVSSRLTVEIAYESSGWPAESDRIKRQSTKDF